MSSIKKSIQLNIYAAISLIIPIIAILFSNKIISLVSLILPLALCLVSIKKLSNVDLLISRLKDVCVNAKSGNLEARIIGEKDDGNIRELAFAINGLLDINDAFIREAHAAFTSATNGYLGRHILEKGLTGNYKSSANKVNSALQTLENRFNDFYNLIKTTEEKTEKSLSTFVGAAHELKNASETMMSCTEEVQNGIDRIGDNAQKNSDAAKKIFQSTDNLSHQSSDIGDNIKHGLELNHQTEAGIAKTNEAMTKLNNATKDITPIANIISKISGQTRMLALNAGIEAQRAGEAGKAFSVVADEVKNLAEQTQEASEDIIKRIVYIEESSNDFANTINEFVANVQKLTEISELISSKINEQIDSTMNISNAVSSSALRSSDVSNQISNIKDIIHNNSNRAHNVNNSAKNLEDEVSSLDDELKTFISSAKKVIGMK